MSVKRGDKRAPSGENRLNVPLGDMKREFAAWCRRQDVTASDAVRQLIARVLRDNSVLRLRPVRAEDAASGRVAIRIALSTAEHAALTELAQRMGFTRRRLMVAMVRALILRQPQFGDREIVALEESNYQLAAIGRNLNQIARVLNAEPGKAGQHDRLAVIQALRRQIHEHLEKVQQLHHANLARWRR